jgi:hypothetical protein
MDSPLKSEPRDSGSWPGNISTLTVNGKREGALILNLEGRRVLGPLQGFGQLWDKRYRIALRGAEVSPAEVIQTWKANFQRFANPSLHFYFPPDGPIPGEVVVINADVPGGLKVSTGVMVLFADDLSFSFMTPQGHLFAGWITFTAYELRGCTVAEVRLQVRASDPLHEIGMRLGINREEDRGWQGTLKRLAAHYGVNGPVQSRVTCLDPGVQWSQAKNIWHNAAMRSVLYTAATPLRWALGRGGE